MMAGSGSRGPTAGLFTGRVDPAPETAPGAVAESTTGAAAARLRRAGRYLTQGLRLMVGVPDYDNYVQHMRLTHPEQTPMSHDEFFRERQDARYGGKNGGRCC